MVSISKMKILKSKAASRQPFLIKIYTVQSYMLEHCCLQ